jgi:hypothetical protein
MRVDEAGHNDGVGGVHTLGITGAEPGTDLRHHPAIHEDVGLREVGGPLPEREHAPAAEQDPRRVRSAPHRSGTLHRSLRLRQVHWTLQAEVRRRSRCAYHPPLTERARRPNGRPG